MCYTDMSHMAVSPTSIARRISERELVLPTVSHSPGQSQPISLFATLYCFTWGTFTIEESGPHASSAHAVDRGMVYMYSPKRSTSACSRWNIWELVYLIVHKLQVDIILMIRGTHTINVASLSGSGGLLTIIRQSALYIGVIKL